MSVYEMALRADGPNIEPALSPYPPCTHPAVLVGNRTRPAPQMCLAGSPPCPAGCGTRGAGWSSPRRPPLHSYVAVKLYLVWVQRLLRCQSVKKTRNRRKRRAANLLLGDVNLPLVEAHLPPPQERITPLPLVGEVALFDHTFLSQHQISLEGWNIWRLHQSWISIMNIHNVFTILSHI